MSTAHSRESAVLCQHIVREHFGPVVSRVAGQLLQRGRLSVREIARYLNMHSFGRRSTDALTQCPSHVGASPFAVETDSTKQRPLPMRFIQQALVILIQHNCVLHSSSAKAQDGAAPPAEEYFEADQDEILARLRFGTYQELMHQWGGRSAEAVIRYILYHGQVQAGAIVEHLSRYPDSGWTPPSGREREPREVPDEASVQRRAAKVRSLLVRMLDDAFVRPSTMVQHVSPQDRKMAYESSLRRTYKGVPTAKMLREIKIKVAAMVNEEDRKDWEGTEQGPDAPRLGFKRKAPQEAGRSKRQRKDDQADAGASHYVNGAAQTDELDIDVRAPQQKSVLTQQPDVWLRVNHDRFGIMIRNQVLIHAVARKYNATTGEVFRHMLQEDQQKDACSEREERSRPITLSALAQAIPAGAKIQRGLDRRSILAEDHGHAQDEGPTQTELLAEYVAILSSHDNVSSAAHATRFLAPFGSSTTTSAGGSAQVATSFTIEYSNIIRQLQVQMLRQMVVERFGPVAGRIFSILTEKGKLEEKHVRGPARKPC